MSNSEFRFDDGAAYERFMGTWSQIAGEQCIEWIGPQPGSRWLDVGCGNGAFTELIARRCSPKSVVGIDPSAAQIAHARSRLPPDSARFQLGDAMALPFADNSCDIAIMPLVIFFVPQPAKGVAEMVRVVTPGGIVAAYAWDLAGGGFPYQSLRDELTLLKLAVPDPPSPDASRIDIMQKLWADAGLVDIQTRELRVTRTFSSFEEYWSIILGGPSVGKMLAALSTEQTQLLQNRMRSRLAPDSTGKITCTGWANAVKGQVAN